MKLIGLLDCNNFFVSCERLFRPDLHDRPVAVLSGNDGCIVARSNEVKDLGVPMGVPHFKVKDVLSEAAVTCFSSNFTLYRDVSSRVMSTLRELVPEVETYSIDEAFLVLNVPNEEAAVEQLRHIKQTIEQRVGVPVSLGAATSKTIAKYASEKEKRGSGVCVLVGKEWQKETGTTQLSQVWGIGARLSERLREHNLHTVADLLAADRTRVAKLFGLGGCRLFDELSEQPVYRLGERNRQTQKSIMSTRSFKTASTKKSVVADAISYHVHHAAAELRELGLQCRYLQVLARPNHYSDWTLRQGSAECTLPAPISDTRVLLTHAHELLDSFFDAEVPYKKAGVVLGWFSDADIAQPDLFGESVEAATAERVLDVFDAINQKYGREVITFGRAVSAGAWAPARELLSPRYTTNWLELPSVKA